MITFLLSFLTPDMMVVAITLAGILMILGFRGIALSIVGGVFFLLLFGPLIGDIIEQLPSGVLIVLMIISCVSILRLILGPRIADHVTANLLTDLIRAPFRLLGWFFRGIARRP
jgi:hypothetical protein